jgi:isochorismate synthase
MTAARSGAGGSTGGPAAGPTGERATGPTGEAGPGVSDALAFVEKALAPAFEPGEVRVVTVPAATDPLALLDLPGPAVFWASPDGTAAGSGSACTLVARGEERFGAMRRQATDLLSRVRTFSLDDDAPAPRLFGGFSFLPGPPVDPWRSFGDATLLLPRLLLSDDGASRRLSIAVTGSGPAPGLLERVEALLGAPAPDLDAAPAGASRGSVGAAPDRWRDRPKGPQDRVRWVDAVHTIQGWIGGGRAEKIVAARHEVVRLEEAPTPATVLRRLGREPGAFRFAFRLGEGTFLGATPERLIRRRGREVRTEALAGTVAAGEEARLAPLLESVKEGAEHAFVVRAIADALEPVCESLTYPPSPEVQRLRHVHHLRTPFEGRLSRPVHVLELVERLHPTPAVGGWPTEVALRWIREHEGGARGWYAAPVGWLDGNGDGVFVVALRSGLLHHDRAHLYAGAGIVADSDAEAELRETEVKLRTMKEALAVR